MPNVENLILIFSLGVFLRSLTYVNNVGDLKKVLISLFISVVVLIAFIFRLKIEYNFGIYSLIVIGTYIICYSLLQINKILPDISEQSILQLSLLSLYIYDINFYRPDILGNFILSILISFTLLTIALGFVNYILPSALKLFFYICFMLLNMSIGLTYFSFSVLNIFLKPTINNHFSYYDAFLSGVAFMYLLANCFYIFWLIPIPGKNQSFSERMQQWREFVKILISKHTNAQLHPIQTSLNLGFIGGLLIINYFFKLFDNFTLILTLITLVQFFDSVFIKYANHKYINQSIDAPLPK